MRSFLIYMLCGLVFFSAAQEKKTAGKDSAVKVPAKKGDSEYELKNYKSDPNDRLILEINHTGWMGLPQGIVQQNEKCVGFNFDIFFDKPIGHSAFSFAYGIGLYSHNFHSNADFVYQIDSASRLVRTRLEPVKRDMKLNRYAQKILEVPVELRFRSKTDRQFKVHLGFKVGYVVNDFRSLKDKDGKIRVYEVKNINPLRYGINFRIGFEQIALTGSYYFTEIFSRNKGPQGVFPYSFGIAIIPY